VQFDHTCFTAPGQYILEVSKKKSLTPPPPWLIPGYATDCNIA